MRGAGGFFQARAKGNNVEFISARQSPAHTWDDCPARPVCFRRNVEMRIRGACRQ